MSDINILGFDNSNADVRVVVAMSGGVDSSVCAALLHEQGYDVVGVTLQLFDYGDAVGGGSQVKSKTCCAGQDIHDARRVSEKLGFPHYVLDYESNFRQSVIEEFADSYVRGETPIPCIRCNQSVKFKDMLEVARDLGADCMATGHYIQRIVGDDGKVYLKRAYDDIKDQSYFLFATTPEQLDFLRFPLGGWSKDVTRQHAERLGLLNSNKPDSQDICFVPHGDYSKIVKKMRPESLNHGNIVHVDGRVVGKHEGIIHYTIGQRKGLGIGGGVSDNNEPLYVISLDAKGNKVIVGSKEALACNVLKLSDCNWLFDIRGCSSLDVEVKFRSVMKPVGAKLVILDDMSSEIYLDELHYGISTGQATVCYIDDRVIGGGWIVDAYFI